MRIGQIVSIEDNNIPHVQTGIIIRRERDPNQAQYFWYEVLANDEKIYILPQFLLSPRLRQIRTSDEAEKNEIISTFLSSIVQKPSRMP